MTKCEKKVSDLTISELFELIISAIKECKSRDIEMNTRKQKLLGMGRNDHPTAVGLSTNPNKEW